MLAEEAVPVEDLDAGAAKEGLAEAQKELASASGDVSPSHNSPSLPLTAPHCPSPWPWPPVEVAVAEAQIAVETFEELIKAAQEAK